MFSNTSTTPRQVDVGRRRALSVIGIGGLAAAGSTQPASGFFSKVLGTEKTVDLTVLPQNWARRQGKDLKNYADFLASLGLRWVTPEQVLLSHAKRRGSVWNSLPPKKYWENIVPTLEIVDRVAGKFGNEASQIVSAYRSPAYNNRCPGASSRSFHCKNVAIDVRVDDVSPSSVVRMSHRLRSNGKFKGGIGSYSTFTHVDTRGYNADW